MTIFKFFLKKSLFIPCIVCLLFACSKDGDQGPIGPEGPQGEQGVPGPSGADGQDGEDGTANVFYSEWIDESFSSIGTFSFQDLGEIPIEELDALTDLVLVYGRVNTDGNASIFLLPFYQVTDDEYYWSFLDNGNELFIYADAPNNFSDGQFDYFDQYRYVVIMDGQPISEASKSSNSTPDYTKMSYEEIAELFDIKD
ncbi:collagen-like protein [Croceitalea marina]|uniref:Collagen-like protein n=1 Tax=Croceitalea marina TaxID=1775166 RepID=A0ABW5MSP9_9FLAO